MLQAKQQILLITNNQIDIIKKLEIDKPAIKKLSYIGNKEKILEDIREVAQELFNEKGNYVIDEKEQDGYKKEIKEIEDVEEMEKLIRDLEKDIMKGMLREEEEQYNQRRGLDDNWDHNTDTYSKI